MAGFDFSAIKVRLPEKLHFGTGGIPLSTPAPTTLAGISHARKLGLDAMELEFVHSVNLNDGTAAEVYSSVSKNPFILTCHGSYYINLNAKEPQKRGASRSRILQAANMARKAGAWSLTFHPAFYLGMEKESVYAVVKEQLGKVIAELLENGNKIWIRPETTGKPVQFGELKEIIRLSNDLEQVMPCIDFAHLHARTDGKNNSTEEFRAILSEVEKGLGKDGLNNMHIHMSGIEYSEKGEKNHLELEDSDFNFKGLIEVWKEFNIKGTVVCESPNLEKDALMMKEEFSKG